MPAMILLSLLVILNPIGPQADDDGTGWPRPGTPTIEYNRQERMDQEHPHDQLVACGLRQPGPQGG